jgi:hypothetical protein
MKEVTSMANATEELTAFDWDLGETAEDEREYPVLLSNVY